MAGSCACGSGGDGATSTGGTSSDESPSAGGNASSRGGAARGGAAGGGGASSNLGGTSSGGTSSGGTSSGGTSSGGTSSGAAGTGPSASGGSSAADYEPGRGGPGCGSSDPFRSGRITVDIDGTEREYVLDVPSSYDTNHPYRLIFAWHWVGVSAEDVVGGEPGEYGGLGPYYGLKALADDSAIFVAPEGIDSGWLNDDDRDVDFARGMLEQLNDNLCIDQDRIFSTGFSYGAMMSIAVGCELGDVFRAIAPMSGSTLSGCNLMKDDPLAFWGAHGAGDEDVTPEEGRAARDIFVERNHCQGQTEPTDPSPCVAFEGCDAGHPVHWCEFDDDHTQWSGAPEPLWRFFAGF
jgi:poly(3-hydroxybutyrate) depolymerase